MKDDDPIKLFAVVEICDDDGDVVGVSIHTTRDGADKEVERLERENMDGGHEDEYSQYIFEREVQP